MEALEAIESRKSIRRFSDREVSDDDLIKVLEAARIAPSWKNMQCWRFVVIREPSTIAEVVSKTSHSNQQWLGKAPVLIIACADPQASGHHNGQAYYLVDVAIAMDHLMLAAVNIGLGTCWIGVFDENPVKEALNIPENIRIVALTPLGYPLESSETIRETKRKSLDEIVCYESYEFR